MRVNQLLENRFASQKRSITHLRSASRTLTNQFLAVAVLAGLLAAPLTADEFTPITSAGKAASTIAAGAAGRVAAMAAVGVNTSAPGNATAVLPLSAWPQPAMPNHPLLPFIRNLIGGVYGDQPRWKLPMLLKGLTQKPSEAVITAYCEQDHDGGGSYTRWGTHIRRGICAADPRYYGPGTVVWIGEPVNESLIVEDTGSAIKGERRFDVCATGHHALCDEIGKRHSTFMVLYRVPPTSRWGDKPSGWEPPMLDVKMATKSADVSEQTIAGVPK